MKPPRFTAYMITNQINGKVYIGVTSRTIEQRFLEHIAESKRTRRVCAIHLAIRKYGEHQFKIVEIACAFSREDLSDLERVLIRERGTNAPNGYNLTMGGDGVLGLSVEIRAKISDKWRGRKHTQESRRLISEAGCRRVVSESTKAAISKKHSGKKLSQAHREKLSASKVGKKMPPRSEIHKAKISAGLVLAHARKKA